jgi:hypothetical protein
VIVERQMARRALRLARELILFEIVSMNNAERSQSPDTGRQCN